MADEKPAAAVAAPDAAEAEYQAELKRRVSGAAEELAEEKPEEPEKKPEGDEPEVEDDTDADEEPAEDEEEGDGEEKPDDKGKYSKAFRKLQKEEAGLQQFKQQVLDKERQIAAREQKLQGGEQELLGFIKALRVDPFTTLLKHGILTEDDAEYASKQLYYHSKAAQADPKNKLEAERLRRERESSLEVRSTREAVEKLQRELEARDSKAQRQAADTEYLGQLDATVAVQKAKNSLLDKAMTKNPTRTNEELRLMAHKLSVAKGAYADPGLVILAWVKERKAILADYGVAEPVITKQAKSKSAVEKKGPSEKSSTASVIDEAAYQKELRARLDGTYVGD